MPPSAFFLPESPGRFTATEMTRGPWSPDFQHAGPPSALLAHEMERTSRLEDGITGRITMDILRPIPIATLDVETRILRPGRRVEQVEAELSHEGEVLVRATAWRLRRGESPGGEPEPAPDLGSAEPVDLPWWEDEVAYHRAFEWRLVSGDVNAPGPACVWTRQTIDLVEGTPPTPLERLLAMGDAASGISWALPWDAYLFPNLDYSLHLERPAEGEWTAMDATTRIGPAGLGQASSVLYDESGRVGTTTQTLMVAKR